MLTTSLGVSISHPNLLFSLFNFLEDTYLSNGNSLIGNFRLVTFSTLLEYNGMYALHLIFLWIHG